jgi:hypothetical protein
MSIIMDESYNKGQESGRVKTGRRLAWDSLLPSGTGQKRGNSYPGLRYAPSWAIFASSLPGGCCLASAPNRGRGLSLRPKGRGI